MNNFCKRKVKTRVTNWALPDYWVIINTSKCNPKGNRSERTCPKGCTCMRVKVKKYLQLGWMTRFYYVYEWHCHTNKSPRM